VQFREDTIGILKKIADNLSNNHLLDVVLLLKIEISTNEATRILPLRFCNSTEFLFNGINATGWPKLAFPLEKKFDGTGTEGCRNLRQLKRLLKTGHLWYETMPKPSQFEGADNFESKMYWEAWLSEKLTFME